MISKITAFAWFALGVVLTLTQPTLSHGQTYMRGSHRDQGGLSLVDLLTNLISQRRASEIVYGVGAFNISETGGSFAGGAGVRIVREEGHQFSLEYLQGATFLRAQGTGELFAFDLNFPIFGSPLAQTLGRAIGNNITQFARNLRCDSRFRNNLDPIDCTPGDPESQEMAIAANRHTTGFGLRVIPVAFDGQYRRDLITDSSANSYIILTPSVLLNVMHVDYRALQRAGVAGLALRVGGSPVAFGAGAGNAQAAFAAGGNARVDIELVLHLGGGHFVGLDSLYRFFGAYHDNEGTSLSAIHSLRTAVSYTYWPSHTRGTGVGYFVRPSYDLNVIDIATDGRPNGQATVNHVSGFNLGFEL